jgi:hypothetical protein
MLYPDSARRIKEIIRIASLFEEKGFKKTASGIRSFAETLQREKLPIDFLEKYGQLFDIFEIEFAEEFPIGKDYRKRVLGEIAGFVFKAIKRMDPYFAQAIMEIYPILESLMHGREVTGYISEALKKKNGLDERVAFYLYCYAYLIIVEGIFDELARILFFLKNVAKDNIPKPDDLERMDVRDILKRFEFVPVFLENWEEKKHIRNAIGHATVYYDPQKDEARFVDKPSGYDRTLSLSRFIEMTMELEDSVAAFTYTIILLRLYDLIQFPKPFEE